jgi:hypothetical protein
VIDFGDTINDNTQEIHAVCIPSNYDLSKDLPVAKEHAQKCNEFLVLQKTASLKSDSDKDYQHTNGKQTVRGDDSMDQTLCSCSKTLPSASHNDGSNYPSPSEIAQENQMVAAGIDGLNDKDAHTSENRKFSQKMVASRGREL